MLEQARSAGERTPAHDAWWATAVKAGPRRHRRHQGRDRGGNDSAFAVGAARRLAAVDAPVAGLDPQVEPGPYLRDGFAISLWTYYAPVAAQITPAAYADVLMRQHAALRRVELDAPHFTDRVARALWTVTDRDQSPDLSDADRELLACPWAR